MIPKHEARNYWTQKLCRDFPRRWAKETNKDCAKIKTDFQEKCLAENIDVAHLRYAGSLELRYWYLKYITRFERAPHEVLLQDKIDELIHALKDRKREFSSSET